MAGIAAKPMALVALLCAPVAVAGCDDSFDLESYEGRYVGAAAATAGPESEPAPTLYGQGTVRVQRVPGGRDERAGLDILFDDRRLFLFEGTYGADGWILNGVGERGFEVRVEPDGRVTGTLDRPDLGIVLDGRFIRDFLALAIEFSYREAAAGIPAGTRIRVDFSLERGGA